MAKTITVSEMKSIVDRATDCMVWIDVTGEIGGGYSICAFCSHEHHWNTKKEHCDNCLIKDLQRIIDSEIVEG